MMSFVNFNKTRKNASSLPSQNPSHETQEKKLRAQIVQTNKAIGFTKRELGKDGLATTKRSSLQKQLEKLKQEFGEYKAKFKKHCGGPFYLDFSKNKNVSNVSKEKRRWWHNLGYKLFSRKELFCKTETEQIKLAKENSRKSQELWAREEEDLQAALALSIQSQQEEAQRKLTQKKDSKPMKLLEQEKVTQESKTSVFELSNNLEKNQTPPKIEDLLKLNEYVYPASTVDFYKLIDDLIKVMSQKDLKEVLIDDIAYDEETLREIKKGGVDGTFIESVFSKQLGEKLNSISKLEYILNLKEYVHSEGKNNLVSTVKLDKLLDDLIKVMSQENLKEVLIDDIAYDKETLSEIKKGGEELKETFEEEILNLAYKVFKNLGMGSRNLGMGSVNQNKSSNTNSCRPTTILSILSEEDPFGKGF